MNPKNQSALIKEKINDFLKEGIEDKQVIYTKVEALGFKRPTVRRVAGELRNELLAKIKILQAETHTTEKTE